MENVNEFVNSALGQSLLAIVVAGIGAAWTAFKGSEVWASRLRARDRWIANIIAAVVSHIYVSKVRAAKDANNGALTSEQKEAFALSAVAEVRTLTGGKTPAQTPLANDLVLRGAIEREVRKQKGGGVAIEPSFIVIPTTLAKEPYVASLKEGPPAAPFRVPDDLLAKAPNAAEKRDAINKKLDDLHG